MICTILVADIYQATAKIVANLHGQSETLILEFVTQKNNRNS